ncbi:MAG: aromatic ring-hydroxylating dioxygenase subunit alpha [Pseudomonadota bacterium]
MRTDIPLFPADASSSDMPCGDASLPSPDASYWEQAGGLRDHWYIACTSAQLKRGQVRAVKLFGRGIAVFRQADGSAAALIDQCVHRGVRLSAGKVNDGCLSCPFHGWRYDGQGRVVYIPSADGLQPTGRERPFRQRSFPVREQDGAIWVFLGDGDPAQQAVFRMPFHDHPDFVTYYMTGVYHGDLSSIAQINIDVSHTVFVHGKLFRTMSGERLEASVEVTPRSVEVVYTPRRERLGLLPWLTNPRGELMQHSDRYFAPNITRVDYHWGDSASFVFTSVISPIDEHRAVLYTCISYKFPLPHRLLSWLRPLMHGYTRLVNRQDIAITRERLAGLANAPMLQQHSVRADMALVAIDKVVAAVQERRDVPATLLGVRPMEFEI